MKLNAVKRICKDNGYLGILDTPNGEQWIGDGHAYYLLKNVRVDEEAIAELMDLTAKDLDKMSLRRSTIKDWRFASTVAPEEEKPLESVGQLMGEDGELYMALRSDGVLWYIKSAWLDPLRLGDYTTYTERMNDGGAVIVAVYNGLIAEAVIGPEGPENATALRARAMRMAGGKIREEAIA